MKTQINLLQTQYSSVQKAGSDKASTLDTNTFNSILEEAEGGKHTGFSSSGSSENILVGKISGSNRTVSELLMRNRVLKGQTWDILSNAENRQKDYTRLQAGTEIYYNSKTGSLSWAGGSDESRNVDGAFAKALEIKAIQQKVVFTEQAQVTTPVATDKVEVSPDLPVRLGILNSNVPTVSHLLKAHPDFASETWKILHSDVNNNKAFNKLAAGTEVFIQPGRNEIVWGTEKTKTTGVLARAEKQAEPTSIAIKPQNRQVQPGDLTEAVKPLMGRSYKDIDCYELLVAGLQRMDIPYRGPGGLKNKLTSMAKEDGLSLNAYLNGEGIIKAAGNMVMSKQYGSFKNWQQDADKLYKEMEPLLDKGQILSFSTRKRGHTGIVSQQGREWTFINSGRLDNSLDEDSISKGVGEENLRNEIRNWFKLAKNNKEGLMVSLGELRQDEVIASSQPKGREVTGRI